MLLQASVDPCPPDRGWGSQAPVRPHFSRRSTGVTGPEAGDLAQLLCGAPPTCGPVLLLPPQRALIVPGAFCRCRGDLFSSSPSPSPTPMQVGGLCWGHFKLLFSPLSLVARRISSPGPSQLALRSAGGGGALESRGSGVKRELVSCGLLSRISGSPGSLKQSAPGAAQPRRHPHPAPELSPYSAIPGAAGAAFPACITFSGAFLWG